MPPILDSTIQSATAYLNACEQVLAAFNAMTEEHRTALGVRFPTLATSLGTLKTAHKPLDAPA